MGERHHSDECQRGLYMFSVMMEVRGWRQSFGRHTEDDTYTERPAEPSSVSLSVAL